MNIWICISYKDMHIAPKVWRQVRYAPIPSETCNVVYLQVLDAKSESKDTLMAILFDLHHRFIEGKHKQYLAIAADAKLYDIIQALKHEYGEDLKWLIPTPGDWHMLKNVQVALMKPYFDIGLRQLAHTSGYPVAAIQSYSQFKRTHHFLMKAWQTFYQVMLQRFLEYDTESGT